MSSLLQKFNQIMPIILALLLPLLSLLHDGLHPTQEDFLQKWVLSFLMIFLMWHSFLVINNLQQQKISFKSVANISLLVVVLIVIFYVYGINSEQQFNSILTIRILFTALIIYIIQKVLLTQEKLVELKLDKERLRTENISIQLRELRNQVDPHFFFNSLNTLRSMVRQNHLKSEQFIIELSDLYRAMLKFQGDVTVPLSKEIEVAKSYCFIIKNRNENALIIDFDAIDEVYKDYKLPTLALQSIVENCIKHNVVSAKTPLEISISTTIEGYIEVRNNIQPKFSTLDISGNGLKLLERRYKLMGVNEGIIVASTEKEFIVKLKLLLPN